MWQGRGYHIAFEQGGMYLFPSPTLSPEALGKILFLVYSSFPTSIFALPPPFLLFLTRTVVIEFRVHSDAG
jgi:hypothetical protein